MTEFAWFGALCDDDYVQLGVEETSLRSSWHHCQSIVLDAERHGFDNVLLPSGYALGIDTLAFASAVAPMTSHMRLLTAVRCGEVWVPQLARQLATLDEVLAGRLTVNIISSDLPGQSLDGPSRYRRTAETMLALKTLLSGRRLDLDGEFLSLHVDPPRITVDHPVCAPLYFGGLSEPARDVASAHADVYLMWPDTEHAVRDLITDMSARATRLGRALRFGYRVHVVVRENEDEARAAARHLLAALDDEEGTRIRARSLDATSVGVRRQTDLRRDSDSDGFVEPNLWTGIGRARSGCGAAIVGNPDQVATKIRRYQDLGISCFILSGYPHRDECARFATLVLPLLR